MLQHFQWRASLRGACSSPSSCQSFPKTVLQPSSTLGAKASRDRPRYRATSSRLRREVISAGDSRRRGKSLKSTERSQKMVESGGTPLADEKMQDDTEVLGDERSDETQVERLRRRTELGLGFLDEVGSWNIASSCIIILVLVLDTYSGKELAGLSTLSNGLFEISRTDLSAIETTINGIFFLEYLIFGVSDNLVDTSKTLRVLRLLRLVNQSNNGRFVLLQGAGEVTVKLYTIVIEFFCIYVITAFVAYEVEHLVNPSFGDLGDSLYWSFLTLTGNDQPFDVYTAQGRIVAVASYIIATAVVSGQFARILATLGDDMMAQRRARFSEKWTASSKSYRRRDASTAVDSGKASSVRRVRVRSFRTPYQGNSRPELPTAPPRDGVDNTCVSDWSPEEVATWLSDIGLGQYSEAFRSIALDGDMLINYVDERVLIEDFDMDLRIHRNIILHQIDMLRTLQ
ncbi:hypothetical protein CYMTET_44061 [Cymbomonas tetramitiformis]|uniref:SAM domain-containing protein n=1 Tax=Cymbomonas tetramitiformis TaxID=36881 RepID=A0AAE0C106_9CHLO|nr:hypothetical protein CYMTET_44061 [Cymbomonas tetramitiformis]